MSGAGAGFKFEDLNRQQQSVLQHVDVLVDGPFIQELADPYKLVWRGSKNQRVWKKEDGVWKIDDRYPYVDVCSSSIKADASSTLCRLTREGLQRLPWIISLIKTWRRIEDIYHTSNFFHKMLLFFIVFCYSIIHRKTNSNKGADNEEEDYLHYIQSIQEQKLR